MINSEKCHSLLKVIDTGSISDAAREMGYTASAVSKALSSLEAEAGFPLLIRSHSGVTPTSECNVLLPLLRELQYTMEKINQTVSGIQGLDIGTLNIGSSYHIYYRWLTKKIAQFFADRPHVKVNAYSDVSDKLSEAMRNHQMDAAIMSRRSGDFKWIHLKWDQLVVLVHKKHKFVSRGNFPLRSLESEPYIEIYPGSQTDNSIMLEENNIKPNTRFVCADGNAAVPIVEAGLGVCIVNELIADGLRGNIVALPIYPQQLVDIGIAIPHSETTSPIIQEFIQFLQKEAKEIT